MTIESCSTQLRHTGSVPTPASRLGAFSFFDLNVTPRHKKLAAVAGSLLVHGLVAAFAAQRGVQIARTTASLQVIQMIEVALPATAVPPPPPAPTGASQSAPVVPAVVPAPKLRTPPQRAVAPPVAAQAAPVLHAKADAIATGDTMVTGDGAAFAGGVTQSRGTATTAVREATARVTPAPVRAAVAVDRSRAPQLAGTTAWSCPFPAEAEEFGLDRAVVGLNVEVTADGRVTRAVATKDPGHGFGREARRCALAKRWNPALDRDGRATAGVARVNVRFVRP